jgi:hypothetical protein
MLPTRKEPLTSIARVSRECRVSADAARAAIQRSQVAIATARRAMERTRAAIDRSEIALKTACTRVESQSALLR